jgi:phosphatidylinositol glycan class W
MLPSEYKVFHESFMRNNNGTTPIDCLLYIIPSSFAIFHTITLTTALRLNNNGNVPARFVVEFVTICLSLVLFTTVFSDAISHIVLTLFLITITSIVKQLNGKCHLTPFVQIPTVLPDFITVGRSIISLITAVCILAVDFQCFPRKLAKTEKFGFGELESFISLFISFFLFSPLSSSCLFAFFFLASVAAILVYFQYTYCLTRSLFALF